MTSGQFSRKPAKSNSRGLSPIMRLNALFGNEIALFLGDEGAGFAELDGVADQCVARFWMVSALIAALRASRTVLVAAGSDRLRRVFGLSRSTCLSNSSSCTNCFTFG